MTANANKLNPNLPCSRTTLDRDTTKLALLEFPAVNPISQIFQVPDPNNVTNEITDTHSLTQHNDILSPESIHSGSTPHNSTLSPESIHSGSSPCKKDRKE